MFQTSDNSQLLRRVLWINAELTIVWSLKHKNTQPSYIFNRENNQNSEPQNGPRRGLDFIALPKTTLTMSKMTIFNPLEGKEHSWTYSKTVQSQVVWKLSLNLCIHWPAILQPIIIAQIITLIQIPKIKWPPPQTEITPLRTPRINGLKSQILKPPFLS